MRKGIPLGKLPPEMLSSLFGRTGAPSDDLLVPPSLGLDFGVVRLPQGCIIVSSDPITGASERTGWYAVNVSANDVATSGNRPRYMQSVVLLPERAGREDVLALSEDMHKTAKRLGITIVGGHTELTPGLRRPIVATTAFAFAESYVTAAGARPGDSVMLTKSAGIEGTAIVGGDPRLSRRLGPRTVSRARRYLGRVSVVEEAVSAYGTGLVHAMHDCTEGGVLGALFEMAAASGAGFEVPVERIPVSRETREVCDALRVDPLKLISSGTLLLAVEKGGEGRVAAAIAGAGSKATTIGRFTRRGKVLLTGGKRTEVTGSPVDEIWRLHRRGR